MSNARDAANLDDSRGRLSISLRPQIYWDAPQEWDKGRSIGEPHGETTDNPLGRGAANLLGWPILSAPASAPVIAYLFTTFPKSTETFLQREIIAMKAHGVSMRLYSLWGGGGSFRGAPVTPFNKWRLLTLMWMIPIEAWRRPEVLGQLLRGLLSRRPPSWLNFWENMLGAGFACIFAREFRRNPPSLIHAAWGGAPATAAWLLWRMDGHRFSAAAHAYDIFEHGGDWWLFDKLEHAAFVHTSTEMGRGALMEHGLEAAKIACIRRGLDQLPKVKALRADRSTLHVLCIARLVAKKGLDRQLRIYAALKAAGVAFEARIVGEGPLRLELERLAGRLGIASSVTFTGHLPQPEVWEQLAWADVLLHTGVVAASGDRDGLPNVIPEAMASGVLVVTSPVAATTEAIHHRETGLVASTDIVAEWVSALRELAIDDDLGERLRTAARRWVEENFDAHKNAARLLRRFDQTLGQTVSTAGSKSGAPAPSLK
ncbi:MAG: glycosyltransferase family 4 protein [Opitutus sp.]